MIFPRSSAFGALFVAVVGAPWALAQDAASSADAPKGDGQTYRLRYKFQPGETIRWQVEHQAQVRTTVGGTTQTAETYSGSVKVWQVTDVSADGEATFTHSVESVNMRQKLTGRQEVTYNSESDATAPPGFEDAAKSVGVPLSVIHLDALGKITRREQKRAQQANAGQITAPLPEHEVRIGDEWSFPQEIELQQKDGSLRKIQVKQRYTLTAVDGEIATIKIDTLVLTPVRDPAIEAQLIQHESNGLVKFDIAAGRVVGQQTDMDRRVVGFQGEASSLHYVTRFVEKLMPASASTAAKGKKAKR